MEVLKGKRDKGTFSPGGRFSLGRMIVGSGYCIGIVVESRMGKGFLGTEAGGMGSENSVKGGNGLEDVWIIGEPFFRDVQVAFNVSLTPSIIPHRNLTFASVGGKEGWHAESLRPSQVEKFKFGHHPAVAAFRLTILGESISSRNNFYNLRISGHSPKNLIPARLFGSRW